MKTHLFYLAVVLLFFGCETNEQPAHKPITYTSDPCEGCPNVAINIPKFTQESKVGSLINSVMEEELISLISYDDEKDAPTIEEAITSFKKGYLELKKKFPDEGIGWEAKVNGKVVYEDQNVLTIELNSYMFTGGAHGYNSHRFLNFNTKTGKELENWELFKNQKGFDRFAETQFRIQEKIPEGESINSTGFMFENDEFSLPENMGFTQKGLKLIYNQYEVASYADGPIELLLPYNEINSYLAKKIEQ